MENKETLEKIYRLNNDLYAKIDTCIGDINFARVHKKRDVEAQAMFTMESLMVGTLQHLCWANQELKKILKDKKLVEELKRLKRNNYENISD